jgi:hypothetical protein
VAEARAGVFTFILEPNECSLAHIPRGGLDTPKIS